MDWLQVFTLFFANASLIVWFRSESRNDWRHMDTKLDVMRAETNAQIQAIHEEMKDFHSKLCRIEERNKGK